MMARRVNSSPICQEISILDSSQTPGNLSKGRELHLLSIDGYGIRVITALFILKEVLRQYQYLQKLPRLPRPCDVFDLAGGAGTGGIIVIMLFRLGMTVDQAIAAYAKLSEDIFSKKNKWSYKQGNASRLEDAIDLIIQSSLNVEEGRAREIRMLDNDSQKCFVCASTAQNLTFPTLFRTYLPPCHASHDCTIVEAIRATTAADPFFPSTSIGEEGLKEAFIDGGFNPVKSVLAEAKSVFPHNPISCVVSIGTGAPRIIGLETIDRNLTSDLLRKIANDCETVSEEVAKDLSQTNVFYCRLNVDHGLEGIKFEEWKKLGEVKTHTEKYLQKHDATQKVNSLVDVLSRRTVVAGTVEQTLCGLGEFLDASSLPGEGWQTTVSKFIEIVEPNRATTETLNMRCALLQDSLNGCLQGREFAELPEELQGSIERLLEMLKKTFEVSNLNTKDDRITQVNITLQRLLQRFWIENHIAGNIMVHDVMKYIQADDSIKKVFARLEQHAINENLQNLNVAPSAAYNSYEMSRRASCFKGTRVKLLNEIASWIASDGKEVPPIYVLDGVAGIGKSTISKTVAENASDINVLGASFFFSRDEGNRKTAKSFFPSIAYQLAYYNPDFADRINKALLCTPHVKSQGLPNHFTTLIVNPLKDFFATGTPILIVIDALDECEDDGDTILKMLADAVNRMPRLKLFLTTRPEQHIRAAMGRYQHLLRFHLQDIETPAVQSDIRLYLDFHLSAAKIQEILPSCRWIPTTDDKEKLVLISGTFFIMASTAVRFILDRKRSPAIRLTQFLEGASRGNSSSSEPANIMDSFYTQILLSAVPDYDHDHDDWFARYQLVVGTIVVLQYPLPCQALSKLLKMDAEEIESALSELHSIVAPTTGQNVAFRIHHKSFPDFVTNASRCCSAPKFLIDTAPRHLELSKRCLRIMDSNLKPNICNLTTSDHLKDNGETQCLTRGRISEELAYACTHWGTHLASGVLDDEVKQLLDDFACKHILAWLEVLSTIGRIETAYPSLDSARKLLERINTPTSIISEIFQDSCRFIALNIEIFKVAAGHVFSAFAFTPQNTQLFQKYKGLGANNLRVVFGFEGKWNRTISVIRHESDVVVVTFSRDSKKLATASADHMIGMWDSQTGGKRAVLRGHTASVDALVFSPNGSKLASGSSDHMVRLWDSQTGSEIAVLRGHTDCVTSVAFSPDGLKLASTSVDHTGRLWDSRTSREIAVLRGHCRSVNSVVFSPDGSKLASGSSDHSVRLWDSESGSKIGVLRGHLGSVNSVVFSLDGSKLASASDDHTVRLWDSQTCGETAVLWGHSSAVNSVVLSPGGSKLAAVSADYMVDSQTSDKDAVLRGHSGWVRSVVFSPDGLKLASASDDHTVRLWDIQSCREIALLRGHTDWVRSVLFSPDGTKLASASNDCMVRLWDSRTGSEIAVLHGHSKAVSSVAFSSDGSKLASTSNDYMVRLWDIQTSSITFRQLEGHSHWVKSVVFLSNSAKLASASNDCMVRLWDSKTSAATAVLEGHKKPVISLVVSPDSSKLASASGDHMVRLWDSQTGSEITVLRGHSGWVRSVVFSPDGLKLASASDDHTVRLWDIQSSREIALLRGHSSSVKSVVFSPDGAKLASASSDHSLRVWDSRKFGITAVLQGHSDQVGSVVFSPDGSKLASASADHTVRLWVIPTCVESDVLRGHSGSVKSVVFSPDGSKLASASSDKSVRLWDHKTGNEVAVLRGHEDVVRSVVFSPGGSKLASASDDCTVRLWDSGKGAVLQGHSASVLSVVFSPDGSKLASSSSDKSVRLWDIQTDVENAVPQGNSSLRSVKSLHFSPDGSKLASTSPDHSVQLWDSQTGCKVAVLERHWGFSVLFFSGDGSILASASDDDTVGDSQTKDKREFLRAHGDVARSVVFSPDGSKFASVSYDHKVRLWDIGRRRNIAVLGKHSSLVKSVVFSPDGTKLASASRRTVQLWDSQTGKEITVFQEEYYRSNFREEYYSLVMAKSVIFSPDGSTLALASQGHNVQLWDIKTGNTTSLQGQSVIFSADSLKLVSVSGGTVRLWDSSKLPSARVRSGWGSLARYSVIERQEPAILLEFSSSVKSVVLSLDGSKLALESDDHTVQLWDSLTGCEPAVLQGHSTTSVFSTDSSTLVSSDGGTVQDSKGRRIANFPSSSIVGFTLDSSKLLLVTDVKHLTLFDCLTSDKLTVPLGESITSVRTIVRVPDSDQFVALVTRIQTSLQGLLIVKVDNAGFHLQRLCWLPPDLIVDKLAVSRAPSRIAIGCDNNLLLLEIDFSSYN